MLLAGMCIAQCACWMLFGLLSAGSTVVPPRVQELERAVQTLSHQVLQSQHPTDRDPALGKPGFQKGLYPSGIHLNFAGSPARRLLRNRVLVPDNNMFVTAFVNLALMEAYSARTVYVPQESVVQALQAVLRHRDRNTAADLPRFGFWNQASKDGVWEQGPENLNAMLRTADHVLRNTIEVAKAVRLTRVVPELERLKFLPDWLPAAFQIPADADDTALALANGAWLRMYGRRDFPDALELWEQQHFNISSAMAQFVKYSYCPLSGPPPGSRDEGASWIDPRTYYWARGFLSGLQQGDCLIGTWLQSVAESRAHLKGSGPHIPFNVNNLDPTVQANALFAITLLVLEDPTARGWFRAPLQRLYITSVRFVAWCLGTGSFLRRPDLSLVYYPARYNVFWFTARVLQVLDAHPHPLPYPVLREARGLLSKALRGNATAYLLRTRAGDCRAAAVSCWDDFLGKADTDARGRPQPGHEDRYFTTAVALEALLGTWTLRDASPHGLRRAWLPDTPPAVRSAVAGAVDWVLRHYRTAPAHNCFYSGSVKGNNGTLPFYYPANVRERPRDGAPVNCSGPAPTADMLFAVRGLIPEAQYEALLSGSCFGHHVPRAFEGFDRVVFPFWSAPVLTKAVALSALSKYLSTL